MIYLQYLSLAIGNAVGLISSHLLVLWDNISKPSHLQDGSQNHRPLEPLLCSSATGEAARKDLAAHGLPMGPSKSHLGEVLRFLRCYGLVKTTPFRPCLRSTFQKPLDPTEIWQCFEKLQESQVIPSAYCFKLATEQAASCFCIWMAL